MEAKYHLKKVIEHKNCEFSYNTYVAKIFGIQSQDSRAYEKEEQV